MDTAPAPSANKPPRLIQSLTGGFNIVAGHITLILLPILLDLLLWFGPHLRLYNLVTPLVRQTVDNVLALGPDPSGMLAEVPQLWEALLERFNLVSLMSSLPVGVPSLLAGASPLKTPLGDAPLQEVGTWGLAVGGFLLFSLVGLTLGSLYFGAIARSCAVPPRAFSFKEAGWEILQTLLLSVVLIVSLLAFSLPTTLIISILALISPSMAQISLMLLTFLLAWLLIPLVFSPHGIFTSRKNVFQAMVNSARLVRRLFPGVGLFLLSAVVLAQGMGYLWRMAPETSWMTLIGIAGNAFIGTALLAASFLYYNSSLTWLEQFRREQALQRARS
jgi:hypothetical protein